MDREQIIKALECCIVNDWNSTKCNECPIYNGGGGCIDELKEITLALITSQEQKIFELENRLKESENGYGGTLALERAKVKELTEENERLHASCTELTRKMQDNVRAENEELRKLNEYEARKVRADTVRKMQERLKAKAVTHYFENDNYEVSIPDIDQIAKEMLEDDKCI